MRQTCSTFVVFCLFLFLIFPSSCPEGLDQSVWGMGKKPRQGMGKTRRNDVFFLSFGNGIKFLFRNPLSAPELLLREEAALAALLLN